MVINFDGGNRNNDAVWSVVAKDDENKPLANLMGRVPKQLPQTNNMAEIFGLYHSLTYAYQIKEYFSFIQIMGDSQLVIRQCLGEYACKSQHLKPIMDKCIKLYKQFNEHNLKIGWVAREMNYEADLLGNCFRDLTE